MEDFIRKNFATFLFSKVLCIVSILVFTIKIVYFYFNIDILDSDNVFLYVLFCITGLTGSVILSFSDMRFVDLLVISVLIVYGFIVIPSSPVYLKVSPLLLTVAWKWIRNIPI